MAIDLKYYLDQLKQKEKKRYRKGFEQPKEQWIADELGYSLRVEKGAKPKAR